MLLKEGDLMIDMLRLTHIQITTANIEISVIDKLNYIRDISKLCCSILGLNSDIHGYYIKLCSMCVLQSTLADIEITHYYVLTNNRYIDRCAHECVHMQ